MDNWVSYLPKLDLSGNKYSQFGEEVYINYILANIGYRNKFVVDLGANEGKWLSNSRMLIEEFGFNNILLDYDTKGSPLVHDEFITAENICFLLEKYSCPKEFTFLSIDLDGCDYFILKELLTKYS